MDYIVKSMKTEFYQVNLTWKSTAIICVHKESFVRSFYLIVTVTLNGMHIHFNVAPNSMAQVSSIAKMDVQTIRKLTPDCTLPAELNTG
jgi:hypothetical protein